ncbi:MAG: hypothetical protein D6812_15295 [Deltaproteobacteria bacterium]|nr:MAG: hypothetical protein D6812_15295 [Deltaproteobacteria bacterium]
MRSPFLSRSHGIVDLSEKFHAIALRSLCLGLDNEDAFPLRWKALVAASRKIPSRRETRPGKGKEIGSIIEGETPIRKAISSAVTARSTPHALVP